MIEFQHVKKVYGSKQVAIENSTFKIKQKEFVFLVGPSGAGKSTLLRMVYKAEKQTNGTIFVFNKNVKKIRTSTLRRNIGIVFQDYEKYLLKNKTALENVSYILESQGKNPYKARVKAMEALKKLGIGDKAKSFPYELSGGEKQRLTIARAIVNDPQILVCDEPTGNLDADNANIVMHYLNQLNQEGTTIIMSTHNKDIIEKEQKRTLYVYDGTVTAEDPTEKRKGLNLDGIMEQGSVKEERRG